MWTICACIWVERDWNEEGGCTTEKKSLNLEIQTFFLSSKLCELHSWMLVSRISRLCEFSPTAVETTKRSL